MLCLNQNLKLLIKTGLTPEMKTYVQRLPERFPDRLSDEDKKICLCVR